MKKELYNIFNPGSIAVIGASNDKKSVGYSVFYNLLNSRGIKNVYPVNIKRKKILQNKCYKSILEIQEKLDLAVIATPSSTALELLDECGKKKVLGVVILSSGFLEDKKNGVYYSDQLLKKAKKYNFRIIGPNCLGFINNNIDLNCTFAKTKPLKGNIAIISQSGAIASSIIDISKQKKIGFNFFVSVGSLIDISYDEIIDYLYDDLNTKSLIIYMESVKNPKKFLDSAKLFSLKKPLLVFKSGKGELGTIAALSHTGNLAGDDVVFNSAIKKTGIIRIESIQELFNSMIFLTKNKIPFGNRIAIITNAGGLGVVSCDYLENSNLNLAKLSPRTIDLLKKALPEKCSFENPIDLLGDSDSNRYNHAINLCLNDNNVDSILVLLTPQSMTDPLSVAKVVIENQKKHNKLILACFFGGESVNKARQLLKESNILSFRYSEEALSSYSKLYSYNEKRIGLKKSNLIKIKFSPKIEESKIIINDALKQRRNILNYNESRNLLKNYEIPIVEGYLTNSVNEVCDISKKIGFPVVMKISSLEIIHKTEINAVKLNVDSLEDVKDNYNQFIALAKTYTPDIKIQGIIIEKMINSEAELMIGSKKDSSFGPIIIFGSGGVYVDLYKDINYSLLPFDDFSIDELIKGTKVYQILKGYRNHESYNIHELKEILYKFSLLVMNHPEIKEIDINPFAIAKNSFFALDARIVLCP